MKKTSTAVLFFLFAANAFAIDASMLVGTWKTTAEYCKNSGPYINGYLEQTKLIKIMTIASDGSVMGNYHSVDNTFQTNFKGNFQLNGSMLTGTVTEVNGSPLASPSVAVREISFENGNMTLVHPITAENQACPVGDSAITVNSRL